MIALARYVILATFVLSLSQHAAARDEIAQDDDLAIVFNVKPNDVIGRVKSGLLCGPNGTLRWRDLVRPDDLELRERLISQMPARSGSARSRQRVTMSIDQLVLNICLPWQRILGRQAKANGKLIVSWLIEGEINNQRIVDVFEIAGNWRDPRVHPDLMLHLLDQSVARYQKRRLE